MVVGFRHNVSEYFEMTAREWGALLVTATVAGFCLSFNNWGDATFDVTQGVKNLLFSIIIAFFLLAVHVVVQKLVGVFYGIKVVYDKYGLGLLIGVLVTMLSFGYVPLFITGYLTYASIPNLRVGKFRATLPKKWETAIIAASGPLASIALTIPINLIFYVTQMPFLREMIIVSVLIAFFSLIPMPLIQTPNPYQVYMSRMETLEGNLPGFDIFFGAPAGYIFILGIVATFTLLALLFSPTIIVLLLSIILGAGCVWIYSHLLMLGK